MWAALDELDLPIADTFKMRVLTTQRGIEAGLVDWTNHGPKPVSSQRDPNRLTTRGVACFREDVIGVRSDIEDSRDHAHKVIVKAERRAWSSAELDSRSSDSQ